MKERPITFDQVSQSANKPASVKKEEWDTGMAVVKTLFEVGKPTQTIEDSICGPNFPNKYDVDGKIVEYMPHWSYMGVETTQQRKLFSLDATRKSTKDVVMNVKSIIHEMK